MEKLLFSILILISFLESFSQPTIQWQSCIGGGSSDELHSIQQTSDGGYIAAGLTASNDSNIIGNHGYYDYLIVKLNNVGAIEWQKCFGGSQSDKAEVIKQCLDGSYIVIGNSHSNDSDVTGNHGNDDFWIVKLNNTGSIQWQKSLGGSYLETASSLSQTFDGGYIVAGNSSSNDGDVSSNYGSSDYWVVKLDTIGNIQWTKSMGGTYNDFLRSIEQTSDSGYIVAGNSYSNNNDVVGNHGWTDAWVVKLNSTGSIQWQKCLGGSNDDRAYSVKQTSDGGFIVAGTTVSNDGDVIGNHGGGDVWVIKLGSSGTIEWQKCLGGSNRDIAQSVQQTIDGGYVVAGFSNSTDHDVIGYKGRDDFWIVKLNNTGSIEWQKCLGGSDDDWSYAIQQTLDQGYVITGFVTSNDSDVIGAHGLNDAWVVKLNSVVGIEEIKSSLNNFSIAPNPITFSTTISFSLIQKEKISIKIYDMVGQEIKSFPPCILQPGFHSIIWDATNNQNNRIENGIYLITITTQASKISKRIEVIK